MSATGAAFDAISFHYYGALSPRCTKRLPSATERDERALSGSFLMGAEHRVRFFATLRDKFAPGKPLWKTETADAACGGNPWAPTFLDSFRYLDQLGRMAKHGVQVMIHNTLAASDYGLLNENDFAPRPNYFMALLWRKLMGNTVLDAGASPEPGLHLYAHCLRDRPGGVALLVINTDRISTQALELPTPAQHFTITADHLTDTEVRLNGRELKLRARDELPALEGEPVARGRLDLAPASVTFVAIDSANNPACL